YSGGYTLNGTNYVDPPEWDISIGNEIDGYLNNPNRDGLVPAVDGTRLQAWQNYGTFFSAASAYVRNTSAGAAAERKTSTTVRFQFCGPGVLKAAPNVSCTFWAPSGLVTIPTGEYASILNSFYALGDAS